jgi:PEP-CTERM motif
MQFKSKSIAASALIVNALSLGFGSSAARGQTLSIDLRVISAAGVTPNGTTVTAHSVTLPLLVGQTVAMGVYGDVFGSTYAALQDATGSFTSGAGGVDSVKGNLSIAGTAPFNATGWQHGTATDLDGDGDNDVSFFGARAPELIGPDNSQVDYFTPPTSIAGGEEYRIASLFFVVTQAGLSSNAAIQFIPQTASNGYVSFVGVSRNVYDDGSGSDVITYGTDPNAPGGGSFGTQVKSYVFPQENTVFIGTAVPEPSTLAVSAIASCALFARRRRSGW